MRIKIGKQSKKIIQYYRINFHFREPYKVVIDGNFMKACVDKKIELKHKLEKTLGGKCIMATTSCVLNELQQLGENFRGILVAARRLPKEKCKHTGVVEPSACIKSIVGDNNEEKVIVATQDSELIGELCKVAGVPIIQISQGKIIVHEPAEEVKQNIDLHLPIAKEQLEKRGPSEHERKILKPVIQKMKQEERMRYINKIKKERNKSGIKMKKKARGPNPMAIKKSIKKTE